MRIGIASGYFNPLHVGHINYLKAAKQLSDYLIVIVNNDLQIKLKGSIPFMEEGQREYIINHLKFVDYSFIAYDKDRTVIESLKHIINTWKHDYISINGNKVYNHFLFCNGGDVLTEESCRESNFCKNNNIELVFGVGGSEKLESSSNLLNQIRQKI